MKTDLSSVVSDTARSIKAYDKTMHDVRELDLPFRSCSIWRISSVGIWRPSCWSPYFQSRLVLLERKELDLAAEPISEVALVSGTGIRARDLGLSTTKATAFVFPFH